MSNESNYLELLDAYTRAHELVNRSLPHVESTHQLALAGAVEEVRRNIQEAAASPLGSTLQTNAEGNAVAAAEKFDDILRQVLLDKHMPAEWERHVRLVSSIVGRWPGINSTRLRSR